MNNLVKIQQKTSFKYVVKNIISLILFALTIFQVNAQDNSSAQQNLPALNRHTFIPNSYVGQPFLNSFYNNELGFAQSSKIRFPLLEIDGKPIFGESGGVLFMNLSFEYQQKVKEWMALTVKVKVATRIGTDVKSLLSQGINSVGYFDISWIFRLAQTEKLQLSAILTVRNAKGNFINIKRFVEDIINGVPDPSISQQVPALTGGGGLRFAYGINDLWGFYTMADLHYGERFVRGESAIIYRAGGTVDLNLSGRTMVPIGFSASYVISIMPDVLYLADKAGHIVSFKAAYTGSPDLSLGVEFSLAQIPVQGLENNLNVSGATLALRYYFN